jgi:hypothetical protein
MQGTHAPPIILPLCALVQIQLLLEVEVWEGRETPAFQCCICGMRGVWQLAPVSKRQVSKQGCSRAAVLEQAGASRIVLTPSQI